MSRPAFVLSVLLLAAGCSVRSGNLDVEEEAQESASVSETRSTAATAAGPATAEDPRCEDEPGPTRRDLVCHRWRCETREGVAAARWAGDGATCNAGSLDADAADRALRVLNLHRFLAGVDPVDVEPAWTESAQECALLAHANAQLSHTPPPSWRCWSPVGALTSSVSLVANRSVPIAIGAFIEDPGNEATMVHRRWLLSEKLTSIGLGSTDRYACVVVDGRALPVEAKPGDGKSALAAGKHGAEPAARAWVAWPPAGPVPMDVFRSERLDEIGWTIQSSDGDLDHATVKVFVDDRELPVTTTHLTTLLGSRSALRFVPDGWSTEAGRAYVVRVTGPRVFELTVEPTDCAS